MLSTLHCSFLFYFCDFITASDGDDGGGGGGGGRRLSVVVVKWK